VKAAATVLTLLAGACAATPTPGREQLAAALEMFNGMPVAPISLVHIGCRTISGEPGVFACRWRQQEGRYWRDWQGRLTQAEEGWKIVGTPSRRP
jgi:hypothetical protein